MTVPITMIKGDPGQSLFFVDGAGQSFVGAGIEKDIETSNEVSNIRTSLKNSSASSVEHVEASSAPSNVPTVANVQPSSEGQLI